MNILASYNWIKEYLQTEITPEEFAREMSLKSMSVESIEHLKNRFENMVIGVVEELKDHPDADRLKIAITNIGDKKVEVVCGGQNLCSGMKVAVALPGAKVLWHGEGDWVELKPTKVRGVESFGMICAPSELGFEKAPCLDGGIWDLSDITEASAGTSFVEAMDLDDVIFDIEVTSNRVDSMSIVGLAREGGVVAEGEFEFKEPALIKGGAGKELKVQVDAPELCPRYMAVVIDGVKVGPSPLWLQNKILLSGHRPINNIVDITNYILHEYGQPLHAFDYEKLGDETIVVRKARDGEKIEALDDNTYDLKADQLVIADSTKPVAVAGVMGGAPTGTRDDTVTVVFEAATFDPVSVRRTSRALNLYSDSQLLFEKGLSTKSAEVALARAVELTLEVAGGEVASPVYDVQEQDYKSLAFPWRSQKTRDIMGVDLSDEEMIDILVRLGFKVDGVDGEYNVVVPFWRDHDIEAEIDFTEEIARVYGYHNVPTVLPDQAPPTVFEDPELAWEDRTKKVFSSYGYIEFYGYSFVSAGDLERYDLDPEEAIKLYNPLSSELTHMRTSLIPSVLKDIEMNQGETPAGQVFELQKVYMPRKGDLPEEKSRLVFGGFGVKDVQEAFLRQKGVLEIWAKSMGLELKVERTTDDVYWHPTRSAAISYNGNRVGTIGQVASQYQQAFGIERPVILTDIDFEQLVSSMKVQLRYEPSPDFPAMIRDIAVEIDAKMEFDKIKNKLIGMDELLRAIDLKDVYQGDKIEVGKKSLTLSLSIRSDKKTLSSEEADAVVGKIERVLVDQMNAKVR
ncbi:phenylalanine--tRNA ligase subunit beta [Candidatus Uhrbacteria bacterium]|jgi:phenylalanyl-tRNA synthetase beta chain|nr:phenylalanine--tRNA ligase subunit beta [Candidatus Uhrbacteria bacterium]MBT7717516.1 phenylalanine--tRNA ligase subunit beta [Candidatus Uhrbacteria bacterium]